MSIKININKDKVEARIVGAFQSGLEMLSTEILNDCNQYCKEDTGALIMSSYIHSRPEKGLLVWQTPYARRQYYEIRTAYKDVNPGASWRWCHQAKRHRLSTWQRQAQKLLEMNL